MFLDKIEDDYQFQVKKINIQQLIDLVYVRARCLNFI